MGLLSLLWGIFALLWMLLAFIPLLGWGNWFMIPFAVVGAIIAAIGIAITAPDKGPRQDRPDPQRGGHCRGQRTPFAGWRLDLRQTGSLHGGRKLSA